MFKTITVRTEAEFAAALADSTNDTLVCPCEIEITQDHDFNGKTVLYEKEVFTFNGGSFLNYLFPSYTLLRPANGDWRQKESATPIPNRRFDQGRWLVETPNIEGVIPEPRILQHLYMRHGTEVHVDDAANITAVGEATHEEVLDAAHFLVTDPTSIGSGYGSIYLGYGEYFRQNQWFVRARINIIGVEPQQRPRNTRDQGTVLRSQAGGNLDDPTKWLLIWDDPQNGGYNGNFDQHLKNVDFIGHGGCRGVRFGGAQVSTIRNCSWESHRVSADFNRPGFVDCCLHINFGRPVAIYDCEIGNAGYANGYLPSGFGGAFATGGRTGYAFNLVVEGSVNAFNLSTGATTTEDRDACVDVGVTIDASFNCVGMHSESPNVIIMHADNDSSNPRGLVNIQGLNFQSPTSNQILFYSNTGEFIVSGTVRNGNSPRWRHLPTNSTQNVTSATGSQEWSYRLEHKSPNTLTA